MEATSHSSGVALDIRLYVESEILKLKTELEGLYVKEEGLGDTFVEKSAVTQIV